MSRTQIALAVLLGFTAAPALARPGAAFARKPKVDETKARALVETLRSDPDEKKRRAAADGLGGADLRLSPDAAPALVRALRSDPSAPVRAEAADSLRELSEVFAQAAVALEEAAEGDPAAAVRSAAKRALWEYHLKGYRAVKGGEGVPVQTFEPPIASPPGPRPAAALVPAPPVAPRVPPVAAAPTPQLPPASAQPISQAGPRMFWPNVLPGPRAAVRAALNPAPPPILNLTSEPPVTKKPAPPVTVAPPASAPEPPLKLPAVPDYVPTLPPFRPDLPSVVTPPWATPLPVPTPAPVPK